MNSAKDFVDGVVFPAGKVDVEQLKPGDQLDKQIALAIGWFSGVCFSQDFWMTAGGRAWPVKDFCPSMDWNSAIGALSEWCGSDWSWRFQTNWIIVDSLGTSYRKAFRCSIYRPSSDVFMYEAVTKTTKPLCVCAAILNAEHGEYKGERSEKADVLVEKDLVSLLECALEKARETK